MADSFSTIFKNLYEDHAIALTNSLKDLSFFGCTVLGENIFSKLIKQIENKNISPLISACYPLEDIVKAQESFLEKKHIGKIVLKVDSY